MLSEAPGADRAHVRGALFETWAVAELLKRRFNAGLPADLNFWRDSAGLEADVVVERAGKLHALEIKPGTSVASDRVAALDRTATVTGASTTLLHGGTARQARIRSQCYPKRESPGDPHRQPVAGVRLTLSAILIGLRIRHAHRIVHGLRDRDQRAAGVEHRMQANRHPSGNSPRDVGITPQGREQHVAPLLEARNRVLSDAEFSCHVFLPFLSRRRASQGVRRIACRCGSKAKASHQPTSP